MDGQLSNPSTRLTLAHYLPQEVGVKIYRLSEEIKISNNQNQFKTRLKLLLVSKSFYSAEEFVISRWGVLGVFPASAQGLSSPPIAWCPPHLVIYISGTSGSVQFKVMSSGKVIAPVVGVADITSSPSHL
ncbi:hypothetical protein J6590_061187 [Homalodisca vitripennis]|nr:hypothetical protein J6590_061187 [Homalodisca vitripennis]